jgi:hypothetical protein
MGGTCSTDWESRSVYSVSGGKSEGKRPLGKHRQDCNIKMDYQELECKIVDLIDLAQDRYRLLPLVTTIMNFRVP